MIRSSPTEIVELETRHMYEDFLLSWKTAPCHFEFESNAITPEDLKASGNTRRPPPDG